MTTEYVSIQEPLSKLGSLLALTPEGDVPEVVSSAGANPFHAQPLDVTSCVQYFIANAPKLYKNVAPSQIEAAYSVLFSLIAQGVQQQSSTQSSTQNEDLYQNVIYKAIEAVAQNLLGDNTENTPYAPMRLRLLSSFFNSFEPAKVYRHPIYVAMLRLVSQDSHFVEAYAPALTRNAETLIKQWTTPSDESNLRMVVLRHEAMGHVVRLQELLAGGAESLFANELTGLAGVSAFASSSKKSDRKREANVITLRNALLAYLNSIRLEAYPNLEDSLAQYEPFVERLLRYGIRTTVPDSPELALDALLEIPIVSAFKNKPQTAAGIAYRIAYQLCFGKLSEYKAEVANSEVAEYVAKHFPAEWLLGRMTAMLIAEVGEDNPNVPYSDIARVLEIKDDDEAVEMAVVDAVTSGLIDAHLNQHNKTIRIDSVKAPRSFNSTRWRLLEAKLAEWKRAITESVYSADIKIKKAVALVETTPSSASSSGSNASNKV